MPNKKTPKNSYKFNCNICNFKCCNKQDYSRHISTAKHKILTNPNEKNSKLPQIFSCICGKSYKHMSSLCSHRKSCYHYNSNNITNNIDIDTDTDNTSSNIVIELLRQNQEFKNLMIDQNKQMHETMEKLQQSQDQNVELQSKMVEIYKEGKTINNNQKFNLNFFLNDTCKDAMSITDFLKTMNVNFDELEYIGNHGYVNGMTKMIMDRLKCMDVTKRPIHCTDIKRETMYIKEDDGWSKDTEELTKLRRILSSISMTNYRTVPDWRNAHPDSEVMDSRNYNFCYKMMQLILGDVEDEQIKLDNKIIKTMAKELFIKKEN